MVIQPFVRTFSFLGTVLDWSGDWLQEALPTALSVNIGNPYSTGIGSYIVEKHRKKSDFAMSLVDFFRNVLDDHRDELEQVAELQKLLEQIVPPKENNQIYLVSVTSNW